MKITRHLGKRGVWAAIILFIAAVILAVTLPMILPRLKSPATSPAPNAGSTDESDRRATGTSPSYAASETPGAAAPFVPRDSFNAENFGRVSESALGERLGVDVKFPASAAGGSFQGIYEPQGESGSITSFSAIYANDVVIEVTVLPTPEDAKAWADDYSEGSASQYAAKVDIGGVQAVSIPKLDVEPTFDPRTNQVVPGTGISTGTAKVIWTRDRFVVSVMNPDKSVDELAAVARDVVLEPKGSSTGL